MSLSPNEYIAKINGLFSSANPPCQGEAEAIARELLRSLAAGGESPRESLCQEAVNYLERSVPYLLDQINTLAFFGPVIFSVTRADLLKSGDLVDVSAVAREAGFKVPVAVTRSVWTSCVEVPEGARMQDEAGRLWDVLYVGLMAAARNLEGNQVHYEISVVGDRNRRRIQQLYLTIGPGDEGEPVITILLPGED